MSEEEIIKGLKNFINFSSKKENFSKDTEFAFYNALAERIQELLDLYKQEKEKNKVIELFRKDMSSVVEIVCMRKEDFERNYESDYISKDKIREVIEKSHNVIPYSNLDIIKDLEELLEEE